MLILKNFSNCYAFNAYLLPAIKSLNLKREAYVAVHDGCIAQPANEVRGSVMSLQSVAQKITEWRRYRTSVRELSLLSDRELADLGINRGDIVAVCRKAARL